MANTSYANGGFSLSTVTSTFRSWLNITNQVLAELGSTVVTTSNSATPAVTVGNAYVQGVFSADTLVAGNSLSGGNSSVSNTLNVTSNVVVGSNSTMTAVFNGYQGANVASATTINLDTAGGNYVVITGNTMIKNIVLSPGHERRIKLANTITISNTGNINIPGGNTFTSNVGDIAFVIGEAGNTVSIASYTYSTVPPGVGAGKSIMTTYANGNISVLPNYEIWADTSTASGGFTVTLPATATDGDEVWISDIYGTFAANNVMLTPGAGQTIEGANTPISLNMNNIFIGLAFRSAAQDWRFKGVSSSTGAAQPYSAILSQIAGSNSFTNAVSVSANTVGANTLNANVANVVSITANNYSGNSVSVVTVSGNVVSGNVFNENQAPNFAAAATINLEAISGNYVWVTGNTGISSIVLSQGHEREVMFANTLTLTNSANLVLLGNNSITTNYGDVARFRGEGSGVVRMTVYSPANTTPGKPVVAGADSQVQYNSNNNLAASNSFTYNANTKTLCVCAICVSCSVSVGNTGGTGYVLNTGDVVYSAHQPNGTIPADGSVYNNTCYPILANTLGCIQNGFGNITQVSLIPCLCNSGVMCSTVCCCAQTGTACCRCIVCTCPLYMAGTGTLIACYNQFTCLPSPSCLYCNFALGYNSNGSLCFNTTCAIPWYIGCNNGQCVWQCPVLVSDCCCCAIFSMGFPLYCGSGTCSFCMLAGSCVQYLYTTNGGCSWTPGAINISCISGTTPATQCSCSPPCVFGFNAGPYFYIGIGVCNQGTGCSACIPFLYGTCDFCNWTCVNPSAFCYGCARGATPNGIDPALCQTCMMYDPCTCTVLQYSNCGGLNIWNNSLTCHCANCVFGCSCCFCYNSFIVSNGCYTGLYYDCVAPGCVRLDYSIPALLSGPPTVCKYPAFGSAFACPNYVNCYNTQDCLCGITYSRCAGCCFWYNQVNKVNTQACSAYVCKVGKNYLLPIFSYCCCYQCGCSANSYGSSQMVAFASSPDLITWTLPLACNANSTFCIQNTANVHYTCMGCGTAYTFNNCVFFATGLCCNDANGAYFVLNYATPYTYNTSCQFAVPCLPAQGGLCAYIKT